jgi:hypothetical protein
MLAESPEARNDDMYLIIKCWLHLHPERFFEVGGEKDRRKAVVLRNLLEFESTETIRRSRQIIQNDLGLYPPTNLKVAKARRMKEEDWREYLSKDFSYEQSRAILRIYTEVKQKSKKSVEQIRKEVMDEYCLGATLDDSL